MKVGDRIPGGLAFTDIGQLAELQAIGQEDVLPDGCDRLWALPGDPAPSEEAPLRITFDFKLQPYLDVLDNVRAELSRLHRALTLRTVLRFVAELIELVAAYEAARAECPALTRADWLGMRRHGSWVRPSAQLFELQRHLNEAAE